MVPMVLPGHIAGGYLATKALLSLTHAALTPLQTQIVSVVGTLSGEAPDIDLIWFYFEKRRAKAPEKQSHRDHPTHLPVTWLVISLSIMAIGYAAGSSFTGYIGAAVLCGSWSHLILDSIEYGVRWLWPFSNRRFCLKDVSLPTSDRRPGSPAFYWEHIKTSYVKGLTFYVEIAVTLIALFVALR
jgi:membrane-bound metal-dependent hydrolase YbcI (DUF457 family)